MVIIVPNFYIYLIFLHCFPSGIKLVEWSGTVLKASSYHHMCENNKCRRKQKKRKCPPQSSLYLNHSKGKEALPILCQDCDSQYFVLQEVIGKVVSKDDPYSVVAQHTHHTIVIIFLGVFWVETKTTSCYYYILKHN